MLSITTDGAADMRAAVRNQTKKENFHCCAHRLDLALTHAVCSGDKRAKNHPDIRKFYESVRQQATVFTTSS